MIKHQFLKHTLLAFLVPSVPNINFTTDRTFCFVIKWSTYSNRYLRISTHTAEKVIHNDVLRHF